jgi:hypothetical protein
MDRRGFCKSFLFLPLLAPFFGLSKKTQKGIELQLITSSPHKFITPLLKEMGKSGLLPGRNFTLIDFHPQKEELIKVLSQNHWTWVQDPSQADLVFTFAHLLKPVPGSFTLIRNEKVWDIRSKNLYPIWQEMNRNQLPSSWLTMVSPNRRRLELYRGTKASVYVDGRRVESLSLKKDYSKSFATKRGRVEVLVENGKARIINSSCLQQICLHTPPIYVEGERIICAPNHFLLEIDAPRLVDTVIG